MTGMMTADLHRLLALGSCAKGSDSTLPMLTHVHMWTHDGYLWAESTDRFMLVRARMPYAGDPFNIMVPPLTLKYLLAGAKTGVREARVAKTSLTVTAKGIRVDFGDQSITVIDGKEHEFPNVGQILEGTVQREAVEGEAPTLDAKLLARLKPFGIVRVKTVSASAPVLFEIRRRHESAPDGIALQMPVRLADAPRGFDLTGWTADVKREPSDARTYA